jgi:hypothetical protein
VLVKLIKLRVRSEIVLGWIYVRKVLIFLGGSLEKEQDTRLDLRVMEFFRGVFAYPSYSSLDSKQNREGPSAGSPVANGAGTQGR